MKAAMPLSDAKHLQANALYSFHHLKYSSVKQRLAELVAAVAFVTGVSQISHLTCRPVWGQR